MPRSSSPAVPSTDSRRAPIVSAWRSPTALFVGNRAQDVNSRRAPGGQERRDDPDDHRGDDEDRDLPPRDGEDDPLARERVGHERRQEEPDADPEGGADQRGDDA